MKNELLTNLKAITGYVLVLSIVVLGLPFAAAPVKAGVLAVTITNPVEGVLYNYKINSFQWTYNGDDLDAGSSCQYSNNFSALVPFSCLEGVVTGLNSAERANSLTILISPKSKLFSDSVNFSVDTIAPVITLIGNEIIYLNVGDGDYYDEGATANDAYNGDLTADIVTTGSVATSTVGIYPITYTVSDSAGNTATKTRTVKVIESIPVITLLGDNPQTIELGNAYIELGATAFGNYDEDLTGNISIVATDVDTNVIGTYLVTYTISDNAGHTVSETRTVNVVANIIPDVTPPVITIIGGNVDIYQGTNYIDQGATALDAVDGSVTVVATGSVDTAIIGSYTITYTATDNAGNTASTTRTVNVVTAPVTPPPSGGGGGGGIIRTIPSATSISINSDSAQTESTSVTLTLGATNAATMLIANQANFSDVTNWETYATSKIWTLTAGIGTKTVYVKFRSANGGESTAKNDTIELVTTVASPVTPAQPVGQVLGAAYCSDYEDGELIRNSADGKIYVLISNQKSHITTLVELQSKYAGQAINDVSAEVIACYPDYTGAPATPVQPVGQVLGANYCGDYKNGDLIRNLLEGKIYVLINNLKSHITTLVELQKKYAGQVINNVSAEVIACYSDYTGQVLGVEYNGKFQDGALIRNNVNFRIYVIKDGKKLHITSLEELRNNYAGKKINDLTPAEVDLYPNF